MEEEKGQKVPISKKDLANARARLASLDNFKCKKTALRKKKGEIWGAIFLCYTRS